MTARTLKLLFRRQWRRGRQKVETIGTHAGDQIDRNLIRQFDQLKHVRRFVGTWLALVLLLIGITIVQVKALSGYYQSLQPVPGGQYIEGILGDYSNANPIYATAPADSAVAHLVFAGLFTYNDQNQLVGNLASSWSDNSLGTVYTVHLRPHLTWQDGKSLTAADVVFTYNVIENPDAQSPLQSDWQGINVAAPNPTTVTFTLPNPLASFPYSLTNGIIPEHLLANIPMEEIRSATFNTLDPIGAGPFTFKAVEETGATPQTKLETIELAPFARYWAGKPKLGDFVIKAYHDQSALETSFNKGQLTAVSSPLSNPPGLVGTSNVHVYSFPLTSQAMVFFKTSSGILSDTNVRLALVAGANTPAIIAGLGYPTMPVREPLLENQLGYNPTYQQSSYNPTAAEQTLTTDGWLPGAGGIRYKNGQPLTFTLSTTSTSEYEYVANSLQRQWRAIGVNLQLSVQDSTDFQNTLDYHDYDALLYGISIGVDPDVFVYWDSSQADPRSLTRTNFSEFSSSVADDALEEGRTRDEPALRIIKYQPFLQVWQQQAPALGLYQPRYTYLTHGTVFGLNEHTINEDTDRYTNVQNWEIDEARVTN